MADGRSGPEPGWRARKRRGRAAPRGRVRESWPRRDDRLSRPRKPELREWLSVDGAGVEAGTFAEAAATASYWSSRCWSDAEEAIADAGPDNFSGKVLIDATNPLDFSGGFPP